MTKRGAPKKPDRLKAVRLNVTITPKAKAALDAMASDTGIPKSRLIERAIWMLYYNGGNKDEKNTRV